MAKPLMKMLYLFLMAKAKIMPKKQVNSHESIAKNSLEKHHLDDSDNIEGNRLNLS